MAPEIQEFLPVFFLFSLTELKSFLFDVFVLTLFIFAMYKVLREEVPKKHKKKKKSKRKKKRDFGPEPLQILAPIRREIRKAQEPVELRLILRRKPTVDNFIDGT